MTTRSWRHYISRPLTLGLVVGLCLSAPCWAQASQWNDHDTVDGNSGAGQYVSMALGGDGKLHLSYLSGTSTYNLNYATGLSGGSWSLSRGLYSGTRVLAGTGIDLDASDLPHLSFYVGGTIRKLYTKYKTAPSSWSGNVSIENVTPVTDSSTSLFMRGSEAHFSFHDNNMSFANYSGGVKTLKVVDAVSGAGKYSSAAVDSQGKFHLVYFDATNNRLMYAYATTVSGTWTKAQIPGTPTGAGGYCALAVDADDNLHISYVDASAYPNNVVKYVSRSNTGVWSTPVEIGPSWVSGTKSGYTSIAVEGSGAAHISYYGSDQTLKHASNSGGSWVTETVPADDNSTDYGMYSAIKVDGSGRVYIAYYDVTNSALKLASTQITAVPTISLSTASLDFGSVNRWVSSALPVVVSNTGQAALNISSISLSGAAASQFSASTCGSIPVGGNCTVTVTLTPDNGGLKSASLAIASNDPATPSASVSLSASSPWLISAQVGHGGSGGSITPAGQVSVAPGQNQSFTIASAGAPFSLADVLVDSVSVGAQASYTFNNVSADHSIESLFVSPIRLVGIPFIYYASLQAAYDAMVDSGTMQTLSVVPAAEALLVDQPVTATIKGGYEAGFSSQTGSTTLNSITISDGNLTPDGLVLQ